RLAQLLVVERVADGGLDQADVGAAVEARALEAVGQRRLFGQKRGDRVGELDLAAGPGTRGLEQVEHPRRQHVAADHGERARRILRPRLLDDAGDPAAAPAETLGGDDPGAAGLFAWHFLGGDDA